MLKSLPDESGAAVPMVEALLTFAECRKFSLILRKDLSARPGLRSLNVICYTMHRILRNLSISFSLEISLFKNARWNFSNYIFRYVHMCE